MSKMIELHDIDVPGFLSVLDSCEGNVYLMTRDGDKLNLKSKLCQLIGLTPEQKNAFRRHQRRPCARGGACLLFPGA